MENIICTKWSKELSMENREKTYYSSNWKITLYKIIFESDTPSGKWFDVLLIISILTSVVVVMLDSVGAVREVYGGYLYSVEWFFKIMFTIENLIRRICICKPAHYARSFF
jgi:voltage-gated potassium channel